MSAQGPIRAAKDTSRDNWRTPPELYSWLHGIFGFSIDAAASEENHLCFNYITARMDALGSTDWEDLFPRRDWMAGDLKHRAFVNAPYGNLLPWVERFSLERDRGWLVVALLPANTDTRWFSHCWETAQETWFLTPRVNFLDEEGKVIKGNTGGSMICVWRPDALPGIDPIVRHLNWKELTA